MPKARFMKRLFVIFIMLFSFVGAHSQEIKRVDPSLGDIRTLLKSAGYELFSFDISSLRNETYKISLVTREYVNGELVKDSSSEDDFQFSISFANRLMISDFPEEEQKKILEGNMAYDADNDIYVLSERISIGFLPPADSLRSFYLNVGNTGTFGGAISMKPLGAPGYEDTIKYETRPFKVDKIEIGGFTPLVMIGSFWYDSRYNIIRFCGENELAKDSSPILGFIPHYYIIGIKVQGPVPSEGRGR